MPIIHVINLNHITHLYIYSLVPIIYAHIIAPNTQSPVLYFQICQMCGIAARNPWHSTSGSGQVTAFDAVFAAAVTLSGCSLSGVQKLLEFVNMGRLRSGAFHRLTDAVVSPVIEERFRDVLEANRQAALEGSPAGLVVAG